MSEHLNAEKSERGFHHMPPIPSRYGGEVRAYESSAASAPHIWLSVECPVDLNEPEGPTVNGAAHLAIEDAIHLAQQLMWLATHHYQVQPHIEDDNDELTAENERLRRELEDNDE
jgi:hypothetical protein